MPLLSSLYRRSLACLALCCGFAAQAAPLSLDQLMGSLAKNRQGTATFTEKKYLALLDQPVQSSGELLFIAPAHLEKRTLKPRLESMVLDGDSLTLERDRRKRTLQLADYPEVAGMIESIRATLAGDRVALERLYRTALEGSSTGWTLVLTPLDPKVGAVVARIRMEGREDRVLLVEIQQADGDRSVMRIEPRAPKAEAP